MNDLQRIELDILKEIIRVLDAHNLRYFGIGGTCLGAIRHNGFIPWDDDIDLGMPRDDYEKFRTEYYKELPNYLQKIDYDTCKSNCFMFFKIHDTRTTYIAHYTKNNPDFYTGVFVDIMPLDGFPNNCEEKNLIKNARSLIRKNGIIRPDNAPTDSFIQKSKMLIRNILRTFIKYNFYSDKFQKLMENYSFDDSPRTWFSFLANMPDVERVIYNKEDFKSVIKVKFEDILLNIPEGYDDYLKTYFGSYMELPPEDQRQSHETCVCDLDQSYTVYAQRFQQERK